MLNPAQPARLTIKLIGLTVLFGLLLTVLLVTGTSGSAQGATAVPTTNISETAVPGATGVSGSPSAKTTLAPTASPTIVRPRGVLAFSSNKDGNFEIYSIGVGGTGVQRLTNDPASDGQYGLSWSPDSAKIAFASDRGGPFMIYSMNADGTAIQSLTPADLCPCIYPTYSHDGKAIAFSSQHGGNWEIYVMGANGTDPANVTNSSGDDLAPSWDPSDTHITFQSNRDGHLEIYVMDSDGSDQRRLTTTANGNSGNPSWSSDGRHIAFVSDRGSDHFDLYSMETTGDQQRRLTNSDGNKFSPVWSPDGRYIAYSKAAGNGDTKSAEIFVIYANSLYASQLTQVGGINGYGGLSWSVSRAAATPSR